VTLPSLTELRIRQLEAERDELTAALGQAREIAAALEEQNAAGMRLHGPTTSQPPSVAPRCTVCCGSTYPCPTVRVLTGDVQ
jgi:hypothetical protein